MHICGGRREVYEVQRINRERAFSILPNFCCLSFHHTSHPVSHLEAHPNYPYTDPSFQRIQVNGSSSITMSAEIEPEKVETDVIIDEKPDITLDVPPPLSTTFIDPPSNFIMDPFPSLVKEEVDTTDLFSASSPPPALPASTSRSRTPSPPPLKAGNGKKGKKEISPPPPPILIDNLPLAWEAAHETFETLEKCVYERKDLGLSKESDEMMVCDCVYDKRESGIPPVTPISLGWDVVQIQSGCCSFREVSHIPCALQLGRKTKQKVQRGLCHTAI